MNFQRERERESSELLKVVTIKQAKDLVARRDRSFGYDSSITNIQEKNQRN